MPAPPFGAGLSGSCGVLRTLAAMIKRVKVAVVGVGNNVSALVQGIALHRATGSLVGIRTPVLDGLGVGDIEFVAAFATSAEKIGKDLTEAICLPPNNLPRLTSELPLMGVAVRRGLTDATEVERVAGELAGAEVVLYAVPSGRQETARAYAAAALRAGAAFINTTSDAVARDGLLLDRFAAAGLPLLGDDLASQFGTSVVHHALLRLLEERGVTLISSYQVNLGVGEPGCEAEGTRPERCRRSDHRSDPHGGQCAAARARRLPRRGGAAAQVPSRDLHLSSIHSVRRLFARELTQLVAAACQVGGLGGVARQLDGFVIGRA
jgi:hypothetical protein